jgi:hypothetical protein
MEGTRTSKSNNNEADASTHIIGEAGDDTESGQKHLPKYTSYPVKVLHAYAENQDYNFLNNAKLHHK